MRRQQMILGCSGVIGMICLILDSTTAVNAAFEAITLCIKSLIPSLFPFFVFSILVSTSFSGFGFKVLNPIGRLFHLPKGTNSILIASFLGGYPVGAQSVFSVYQTGSISKKEAERLLAFCSNAGPSFLFGIAAKMFPNSSTPWILWGIHIISAWIVSCFFQVPNPSSHLISHKPVSINEVMRKSILAMGTVCGWVIIFRIILGFLNRWILWTFPLPLQVLTTGILELANGCCNLCLIENESLRFVICSAMLALGGVCVTLQTASVIQGLSIRFYVSGKILQGFFSVVLSLLYVTEELPITVMMILTLCIFVGIFQKCSGNLKKAVV